LGRAFHVNLFFGKKRISVSIPHAGRRLSQKSKDRRAERGKTAALKETRPLRWKKQDRFN
jgi:hypothetical protein